MHIINRFFLRLVLLPLNLYHRLGVDPRQLKAILTTKLTLDDRRPQPITQATQQKKPVSKATLSTMFISAVMGVFFLFCFSVGADKPTQLTLYFSFFFVFLSLTLITDFTSVLIDVRDNFILLPKPVSDKTIVVARLLHIFIHLCKIVLPMGLPGVIFLGIATNVYGGLLLLLLIFLLAAFAIFCINAVYIAILKFTTPQRFQAIITYVQILFAIVVYGSYQFLPRLLSDYAGDNLRISELRGIEALPLYWMATAWNLLFTFRGSATEVITAIAGLLLPVAGIWVVVQYLAPSFNRKLSLLSSSESSAKKPVARRQHGAGGWLTLLSRSLTTGPVEKASFLFTWKMTARSRDFKLKVYPSIGYLLVVVAVFFFRDKTISLAELRENGAAAKGLVLAALYFSFFLVLMAVTQMAYSDKHKASWIFYTSPVAMPGYLITGAAKAVLLKFYAPFALLTGFGAVWLFGLEVLPNILLGVSNVVLIIALVLVIDKPLFPFSAQQSTNAKTGTFMRGFGVLIVTGVTSAGHYLAYPILPVVLIALALSLLANWLLFDSLRNLKWAKIVQAEAEAG